MTDNLAIDTTSHAILGGVGEMIGGGKFANGAATGAFGYLFNKALSNGDSSGQKEHFASCVQATVSCANFRNAASGVAQPVVVEDLIIGVVGLAKAAVSVVQYGWNTVRGIEGFMNPAIIRLSQNSASATLSSGMSISEMAAGLASGVMKSTAFPPVRLTMRDGLFFTLDNRRLIAYNLAKMPIPYRMATLTEINYANSVNRFSSINNGLFASIKGKQ